MERIRNDMKFFLSEKKQISRILCIDNESACVFHLPFFMCGFVPFMCMCIFEWMWLKIWNKNVIWYNLQLYVLFYIFVYFMRYKICDLVAAFIKFKPMEIFLLYAWLSKYELMLTYWICHYFFFRNARLKYWLMTTKL